MYICPICKKEYAKEELVVKCFSKCYKLAHPYHQSTPAPQSEDIIIREVSNEIMNFFNSFKEK